MLNLTFDIAVASSRRSTNWMNKKMTWQQLLDKIAHPKETPETYAEYMSMEKAKQDTIKDKGGFVGGKLREGKRRKGYVEYRQLLCLDMDFGKSDFWESFTLLYDYTCCIYSTHKHCKEKPRYRLIFPLSRKVSEEEYEAIARKLAEQLGINLFDDTTYEPTRLMYWPTKSKEAEYFYDSQEGSLVDVDKILGEYRNWKDCREWPRSSRVSKIQKHELKMLGDPTQKEGIVGDFCKAYTITEAIETFLADVYVPCEDLGPNRYTYTGGSTSGGAVVYGDKYLYSHHSTDPAGGNSHNSFDLVRIHLFGSKDEGVKESAKTLPSMKAMIEFVQKDSKVKQQSNKSVMAALGDEDAEAPIDITYYNAKGAKCLDPLKLAKYMREHCSYLVVRKRGFDSEFLYWYENGYYSLISPNEFKGKIKAFIPDELCKPHAWEEVYKHLMTDVAMTNFELLDDCSKYINLKNGLYNIETKQLEPHSKDVISTIQLNATYNPEAPEPLVWLKFIDVLTNGDQSLAAILQEWFGLTISNIPGYLPKKCLGLASPVGNTGKTQFNNMLAYMIGRENICASNIQQFEKNFGMGSLYGKKAVLIDDQTATSIEDSSNFKKLTGGGLIDCELKGRQAFPYIFRGTITFGCNDLPYFKGDKGTHLFDRFIIIPCDRVLAEEERVGNILEQMEQEVEGILLWALEGLHRLKENDYRFTKSEASTRALEEYRGMNDSLYSFISEHYIKTGDKKDRVLKTDLEKAYQDWCTNGDIEPIKKKNVAARALKHGIKLIKSNQYYYVGIKRKP